MPLRQPGTTGEISWRDAVVGGACLAGVMWATIIHLAMAASDHRPHVVMNWTIVGEVCIPLIAIGLTVARWGRRGALRTVGVAAVIAPLTGAAAMLGFLFLGVVFG